ncbi:Nif3-like dinuclear metal center hexameric protein [Candidatus Erwinia haradaeae]|uniref:GTP cyclohydrolase 1 type 2 homolog n=1 Tax=Candidatus Erwinia haradaeae TaxID=1922217 RepID=A0A803FUK1_9GAMM|nr:Nif3-like dinuclear metal center hexameric protein [Candidatus Erwinia haradaeae]VFP88807.1 GTP cyclohydrolase 1 type 2 homolog [Candidatus Erwinia haradaeae]
MRNTDLEKTVNQLLHSASFSDYTLNGLQIEGRSDIKKVVTGVTACYALLTEAVRLKADAVLVHHGYFWKNDRPGINGMQRDRIKIILENDLNLFAWHLPLDAHPNLGNNVQLATSLGIKIKGEIKSLLPWGELDSPLSPEHLKRRIHIALEREPLHCFSDNAADLIRSIALCSGGGQGLIDVAASFGVDAFITGEASEKTTHSAREQGLHFFAAGHHATERGGVKALGQWLSKEHFLDVTFIDISNPV